MPNGEPPHLATQENPASITNAAKPAKPTPNVPMENPVKAAPAKLVPVPVLRGKPSVLEHKSSGVWCREVVRVGANPTVAAPDRSARAATVAPVVPPTATAPVANFVPMGYVFQVAAVTAIATMVTNAPIKNAKPLAAATTTVRADTPAPAINANACKLAVVILRVPTTSRAKKQPTVVTVRPSARAIWTAHSTTNAAMVNVMRTPALATMRRLVLPATGATLRFNIVTPNVKSIRNAPKTTNVKPAGRVQFGAVNPTEIAISPCAAAENAKLLAVRIPIVRPS